MKKALPDNAKIAKDAKETVQECVSEFISFITSEACEKCKNEKRKTINGEDILSSIQVSEILYRCLASRGIMTFSRCTSQNIVRA